MPNRLVYSVASRLVSFNAACNDGQSQQDTQEYLLDLLKPESEPNKNDTAMPLWPYPTKIHF